jgi:Tfp pilus assembly protein PilO
LKTTPFKDRSMQDAFKRNFRIVNTAGIVVILSILAGSVSLGVVPAYRRGVENINATQRLKQQLAELNGLTTELNAVEMERQQTEKRLQAAEARLPSSDAMDEFMQQLASVAEKAGMQVDSITPSKDLKDSGGYKSLPVEINGTGDWESCYRFLTGLRAMNRLTRLDSVSLDSNSQSKETKVAPPEHPVCQITVNISTFMAR